MGRIRLPVPRVTIGVAVGVALLAVGWSSVEVVLGAVGGIELPRLLHCLPCLKRALGFGDAAAGSTGTGVAGAGTPPGAAGMSDEELSDEVWSGYGTDVAMEGLGQGAEQIAKGIGRAGAGPTIPILGVFYTLGQGSMSLAEGVQHTHDYEYQGSKSRGGKRSMDAAMDEILGKKKRAAERLGRR